VDGVVDVLTADGVPGLRRVGGILKDHYVLAEGRVRYVGDVVAMVAAETPEAAVAGARAVRVELRPLAPLLDPEQALRFDAARVHPERPDNVVCTYHVRRGDAAEALARSDTIVERDYRTQYVEHAYLEPEACVAIPEADGSVTVQGGMQHPFTTRRFVSWATGLPLGRVRIVQATLGGAFGGKDDTISVICARAAIQALRTRRPVRIVYTREESIRESYKRHPFRVRYRVGAGRDGRMRALQMRLLADAGPYCSTSPFVVWRPTVQCTGPYLVPDVHAESSAVYTNGPLTGAMRGFGSPQINFAIESTIDDVAHAVGLDPVEFRRRNFFPQGCTTHTGQVPA
jgi:CO/xanthine dehydrogenase Mo-binding subunit